MTKEELELVNRIVTKGNEMALSVGIGSFFLGAAIASLIWLWFLLV